ncbi:MAG: 1-acyl-sn-glycerol-3-phosphate acyltransferase [Erysipelotrichaceae bacterium]|nr:1-acyl-sn-glycerol-3-phosphate acyltransferase [Erysipelotrichaceae bacterium]
MFKNFAYQLCRLIIVPVFRLYYQPKIVGKNNIPEKGSVILAGNHKHALDPIFVDICTKRTVHALAKSELFEGPFAFFFKSIGAIPVYLEARNNPEAYRKAKEVLLNDQVINISPEAARNYTEQILLPFKSGAVRLAKETGTAIVPYCIKGNYRFLSKDLKIVFGEPLKIDEDDMSEANGRLYNVIERMLLEN